MVSTLWAQAAAFHVRVTVMYYKYCMYSSLNVSQLDAQSKTTRPSFFFTRIICSTKNSLCMHLIVHVVADRPGKG